MAGYYAKISQVNFEYTNIICSTTKWLMSPDARRHIAKLLKSYRKKYTPDIARDFRLALIHAGAIYPLLPANRPINKANALDFNTFEMMAGKRS